MLIIFAILMTGEVESGSPAHSLRIPVGILAALFGALAVYVAIDTDWRTLDSAMEGGTAQRSRRLRASKRRFPTPYRG